MSLQDKTLYEFGPYRVDKQRRLLWRAGQSLAITAKAMEILLSLLERKGQVVTKDQLMQALWPDSYVEEGNLTQNVFLLRKVLGETARDHNYIVTVPGTGYRFGADVREIGNGNGDLGAPKITEPTAAANQAAIVWGRTAKRSMLWVSVAAGLLILVGAAYSGRQLLRPRPQPSGQRVVIAILPFVNLTGDNTQEYLSDGLTEEIIAQLGRLDPRQLGVTARTSVMRYKNGPGKLQQIAKDLSADYVLEGSVRREAQQVRVTAQLIQLKDETHVWSRQYDRELGSLLALQSTIAQEVADEIEHTLGNGSAQYAERHTSTPKTFEAYDLYLKGRFFWNKRTPQGFQQAIRCFEDVIARDPDYAAAYAGLADSYVLMSGYSLAPAGNFIPQAREAAQQALQRDESLAEAHASLALIAQDYDWDWPTAEREFQRAIQLDPNYATAHHWYAEHLALRGRFDESFVEIERARRLDPLSLIIATDYAAILYFARQYDRAVEQFLTVREMEPNFPRAHMLFYVYVQQGRLADAIADVESWARVENSAWVWALRAYGYRRSGQSAKTKQALTQLQRVYQRQELDPLPMVVAELNPGNQEKALAWLHEAYLKHSSGLTALKVDPVYDPLRNDPRFQEVMRGVGLAN